MQLPPGPRAPAVWQTLAWMARPGAFMRDVHARYGDPVTIRTYWTEEPMVLFSQPGRGPRGVPARSGDRARRAELGVPAPVRGRALDPAARRRGAPARAAPAAGAVPRRADAGVRADDRRARARRARGLERPRGRARADARADARDHPARRVRRRATTTRSRRCAASIDERARHRSLAARGCSAMAVVAARPRPAQPVGTLPDRGASGSTRCCSSCSRAAGRARGRGRSSRC